MARLNRIRQLADCPMTRLPYKLFLQILSLFTLVAAVCGKNQSFSLGVY
ncbi:hypothetical protein MUP32_01765 [Candidatus Microgenomates bacterium]|nr:hypothetical protein [Candidatus Microgenomates bacterium]